MYQGFYNLTSGMLTERRRLATVSSNMANTETAGYKKGTMVQSTFQDEMLLRTGRTAKKDPKPLGVTVSKIVTAKENVTDYSQGSFDETGNIFDFAINGDGFFNIETPGGVQYTRNGSFSVDQDGYLELTGIGRVLGTNGQPIQIPNEDFTVDGNGNITTMSDGKEINCGTIRLTAFQNTADLHHEDNGMYSAKSDGTLVNGQQGSELKWQMLENSNVDMTEEMTTMMASQRAFQSAAQLLKMYDQVMSKSSTDVGRL